MLSARPLLLPCAKYPPRRRWIWLRICICIIYVTRGRGAKSARPCAVDHCVSFVSIFIYLFALLRARPPNYHDAAPPPALIRRRPELFIFYIVLVDDTPPAAPMSPLVGAGLPPAGPARRGEPSPRPRSTTTRSGESSGVAGGIGGAHGSQMVLGGADGRSSTRCSPRMYS